MGEAEIVTVDVHKLGEASDHPVITDDMKEFQKAVQTWRHAGESMEEPG